MKIKTETRQGLVLTIALKEALSVLTMPLPSLAEWLQEQIEQNPALQFRERRNYLNENSLIEEIPAAPITLYEHLLAQAREALVLPGDLKEMEELIGTLDDKGFIESSYANSRLLPLLQSFDPPGIGAATFQQSLLLQLERKGEKRSPAYRLIRDHYNDLLCQRKNIICKKLPCTLKELESLIKIKLSCLSLNPAAPFLVMRAPMQPPDIFVEWIDSQWVLTLNDELLPQFYINPPCPGMKRFETRARWIEKIVAKRGMVISQITQTILEVQSDFFHGKSSDLQPLSLRKVAVKLHVHESTVSRAVKDKFLSSPKGIFPLRFFFSQRTADETISCHTAKERLKLLIQMENKKKPLSDQALSKALYAQGITCARRTVSKYRKSLKIPPAFQRN